MTETNRPLVIDYSVTIGASPRRIRINVFFFIDAKDITIDTSLLSMVDVNC